jgi:hypothetical protein
LTNIYSLVYDTLLAMGYPVKEQGTYSAGATLPETHVTYQIIDSPNNSHADNAPTSQTTRVQVTLYSKKPALKQGADEAFKAVLLPAGFMRAGGRDLPFAQATGHYAYTCDYRFYDTEG